MHLRQAWILFVELIQAYRILNLNMEQLSVQHPLTLTYVATAVSRVRIGSRGCGIL